MKLTRFFAAVYTIGFEVDGRELAVTIPYDGANYAAIRAAVLLEHGVTLPEMTQEQFGNMLNLHIAAAIADGDGVGPVGRINRVITGRDGPQRH